MHALPSIVSLAGAALLAPGVLGLLRRVGHMRANYRGRELPCPFGVLALAVVPLALIPLALVQQLGSAAVFEPRALPAAVFLLGVLALGLVDDTLGSGPRQPRGWRGHGAALARGQLTTGALKAAGSLGLALYATSAFGLSHARWLLASAVLVLATGAFNLLDLRPGRALKAFAALTVALTAGARDLRPLWTLGLFAAPALVAGVYDLRERAMLGDTGAGLLGALAGLWLVLTLSVVGQLLALAGLAIITLYGEIRSISRLVERVPALRELDSWGRPS
jgi:UDP-N-acetylmuramyl pentapeptide phosphotransferase/UDP-N-acetylglucosamine-1-phosphate transferase